MSVPILKACHSNGDNWVLHMVALPKHGLVASLSNGTLNVYPLIANPGRDFEPMRTIKAHDGSINGLKCLSDDLVVSAGTDGTVKVFDLSQKNDSPVHVFRNERGIPFLSLDVRKTWIAAGTELKGADAELLIWDWNTKQIVRTFSDSHHDDVTEIKFHPTIEKFMLSGSTDGYVNIYNLDIEEEEDAQHQVINFASIHSAGWLSEKRIYTLSHMETFAIHELNDTSDELNEPQPKNFGDIRESWDCEYVVDVYPGFIATGCNSRAVANLYPFANETIDLKNSINLNSAHGEEVMRCLYRSPVLNLIYTGGEDGCLKVWKPEVDLNALTNFFVEEDAKMSDGDGDEDGKNKGKNKEKNKEKKEKKDKKAKKEKKQKKEKKNKKHRFNPY